MGIVNLSHAPADLADENECELLSWLPVRFGFVNLSELALLDRRDEAVAWLRQSLYAG